MEIRNSTIADLGGINALLVRAFSQPSVHEDQPPRVLPLCCEKFLLLYLQDSPMACFVAVERHRLIAAVFGHCWGQLGWIGPLAVSPEYQGRGIGKSLVEKVVASLKACGCRYIGLETHPANIKNINFYIQSGFVIGPLMVDLMLKKSTLTKRPHLKETLDDKMLHVPELQRLAYSQLGMDQQPHFLQSIEYLTQQIDAKINMHHVIKNLFDFRYGETFLYQAGDEPLAFVIMQTGAVAVGEKPAVGRILALGLKQPLDLQNLGWLLSDLLQHASLNYLVLRVPAIYHDLTLDLLQQHFTLVHTSLRMYLLDHEETQPKRGLLITKWE